MLVRPSGEQLTKLQPGMIDHPVQTDSYSCGVIVIKVGTLHCIFSSILYITFFKNANDGFVTLQLATEFLKQLPGTLKKPEFSTNGNYLRKMRIDLAKSILADTSKTGTAPQGVRENDSSPNICAYSKVSRSN